MNKTILKKIFYRIRKYFIYFAISMILACVTVISMLYLPILTGDAIDQVVYEGQVNFIQLFNILKTMGIVILISALSQWLMNLSNNKLTYYVVRDIRNDAIKKIETLPLGYLDRHATGEIVSKVIADVEQFADGLLMGFSQFFTGVITILGTLLFMISINGSITVVVVVVTPVSLVVASFIARKTYHMFKLQSQIRGEQTNLVNEMVQNHNVVAAFSKENQVMERFDAINERLSDASLKATFFSSITNPSTRFVNSLVYTGVGIVGAFAAINGSISIGQLTCFLSYANQYTKPFNEISGVITELQNAFACAARVFELLEQPSEVAEVSNAVSISDVEGNVIINHVSFSYVKEKPLLKDFCLDVKAGTRIAIVGPTGCGKTTLINLLMRFYDVKQGDICVDQHNIQNLTRKSLRNAYGMVLQETWLKAGTIEENIKMGNESANREAVIEAAKKSHAHSFIKRLPKGYDTYIDEDGGNLSQGQKQLLCIARVMLSLPPMLILDEATSSIDTRTETKIQAAFQTMMKGRTSFVVAHRLSTIMGADIILVMRDGNIVEYGNHQELIKMNGFYSKLYNSQFAQ